MAPEVNNLTRFSVNERLISKAAEIVLKKEGAEGEVSVALVGEKRIREANRIYRKKDKVTDVLSFFYSEKGFLGEVVLCPLKIKKNSKKGGFTKEICRVTIHGVLHLLGYEDTTKKSKEEMEEKTNRYLKIIYKEVK